ncbi:hypothetical protein STAFG_1754 [Streptomyces afghaniensis 772]|uniref:Uncharacterized protein n=1 Tax=Streptomyces afghaniensis 772 TaxID=1283301 RepID=S4NRR6_9ACTN|nr:hypothetical protein STAFG_1754 [Streptomyces afghaniensis 772]
MRPATSTVDVKAHTGTGKGRVSQFPWSSAERLAGTA